LGGPLTSLARELDVENHVTFLGRRNDGRYVLELCDILVFPSLFEGVPGALIEASGAGEPWVASNPGSMMEVVENGISGLLVPMQSFCDLAQAIIQLEQDPDLVRAIGRRGQEIVVQKFSFSENIEHLQTVYDEVTGPEKAYSDATQAS
jgi:glycosyltransferase involved in cell wall biosynthesis